MIERLLKFSSCRVECGDDSGTGFFVTQTTLLTARHVVIGNFDGNDQISVRYRNEGIEESQIGTVIEDSIEHDYCIVDLKETVDIRPATLSLRDVREGENWVSYGYPESKGGLGHRLAGDVAQRLGKPLEGIDFDLSVDTKTKLDDYAGLSGAPLAIDSGEIVGFVLERYDGGIGAISIQEISKVSPRINSLASEKEKDIRTVALAQREEFTECFSRKLVEKSGNFHFLQGAHGIGKTTFCENFRPFDENLIHVGTYSVRSPNSVTSVAYQARAEVLFDWLATSISVLLSGDADRIKSLSYTEMVKQLEGLIGHLSDYCKQQEAKCAVIFVDGLDDIQRADPSLLAAVVGLFPQSLPSNIAVIFSAPSFDVLSTVFAQRVSDSNVTTLPPLTDEECYLYCLEYLPDNKIAHSIITEIVKRAEGHPLYMRYMTEYAEENTDFSDFPIIGGNIGKYYKKIWRSLVQDVYAIAILSLFSRLRWGLDTSVFRELLRDDERLHFQAVFERISHLLRSKDTTEIYHPTFSDFIERETLEETERINARISDFCQTHSQHEYCTLNLVFHMLLADPEVCSSTASYCTQAWVDECVRIGVSPDNLIFDIENCLRDCIENGAFDDVFRLLLLLQRIIFRYDVVFGNNAAELGKALAYLDLPRSALDHVLRYGFLLIRPEEALSLSYLLIERGHFDEAEELLDTLRNILIEAYEQDDSLGHWIDVAKLHSTVAFLQSRFLGKNTGDLISINHLTIQYTKSIKDREKRGYAVSMIGSIPHSLELLLQDSYSSLEVFEEGLGELEDNTVDEARKCYFQLIASALPKFATEAEAFEVSTDRESLKVIYQDLERLIELYGASTLPKTLREQLSLLLAKLKAPYQLVELFIEGYQHPPEIDLHLREKDGVNPNYGGIQSEAKAQFFRGFLTKETKLNEVSPIWNNWEEKVSRIFSWCFWIEGRTHRALSENDEGNIKLCHELIWSHVIEPLDFPLKVRASWRKSYAIPESVIPIAYGIVIEILISSFPKSIPSFLDKMIARTRNQFGLYTEGFRRSLSAIVGRLCRHEDFVKLDGVLGLLRAWRDHCYAGVENRHELVPELLSLIHYFTISGASEEARRIYDRLLKISMGPTWYKEDQLSLMTTVLAEVDASQRLTNELSQIAGYLDQASGEMTFQRFVRQEKESFCDQLLLMSLNDGAFSYAKHQICGSLSQLLTECVSGGVDRTGRFEGARFAGNGIVDQFAMLKLAASGLDLGWHFSWAVLEAFAFGDSRYFDLFACEFSKLIAIADSQGQWEEVKERLKNVFFAEIPSKYRRDFYRELIRNLSPQLTELIQTELRIEGDSFDGPRNRPNEPTARTESKLDDVDAPNRDDFVLRGVVGSNSSRQQSSSTLDGAEKQADLGNLKTARCGAIDALSQMQEGGWPVWNSQSSEAQRAEELLIRCSETMTELISSFSVLFSEEHHSSKWEIAIYLLKVVSRFDNSHDFLPQLGDSIEHVRLMLGDAEEDINKFGYLDTSTKLNSRSEVFSLLMWNLMHPKWLRRSTLANMLVWLASSSDDFLLYCFDEVTKHGTEINRRLICGIIEVVVSGRPEECFKKISERFDLADLAERSNRLSVLTLIRKIAATNHGLSNRGKDLEGAINRRFRDNSVLKGNLSVPIPEWAEKIRDSWTWLESNGLASSELLSDFEAALANDCSPLTIKDAFNVEVAVSKSFREQPKEKFCRWEVRLQNALDQVLIPYLAKESSSSYSQELRCFNPSYPAKFFRPLHKSIGPDILSALRDGNEFADNLFRSEFVTLNHVEMFESENDPNTPITLDVTAVVVPDSMRQRALFPPAIRTSFTSNELPEEVDCSTSSSYETCVSLNPTVCYFGSFTPAVLISKFRDQYLNNPEIERICWREERLSDVSRFGRPLLEGCSLSISRGSLSLPASMKIAWVLKLNSRVVAFVDVEGNNLF